MERNVLFFLAFAAAAAMQVIVAVLVRFCRFPDEQAGTPMQKKRLIRVSRFLIAVSFVCAAASVLCILFPPSFMYAAALVLAALAAAAAVQARSWQ